MRCGGCGRWCCRVPVWHDTTPIPLYLKSCFGSVDRQRVPSVKTRSSLRFPAVLGLLLSFSFSAPAFALSFTDFFVDATASWVDTGILIDIGDQIDMTATGLASGGSIIFNGPDGDGGPCGSCIAPVPASHYALVGRIGPGPGTEFLVGASYSGTATAAGSLFLAFNDDNTRTTRGLSWSRGRWSRSPPRRSCWPPASPA